MSVIILLIVTSLLIAIGFLISYFWAVNSGQYEDEYSPAVRILNDPDKDEIKNENKGN